MNLFVSKCHIVGNCMSLLKCLCCFVLKLCTCFQLKLTRTLLESAEGGDERISVFMTNLQEINGLGRALGNRGS